MKRLLLDLFCGAGGAGCGYVRAGFAVVGVDHRPQPGYCAGRFVQADALDYLYHEGHRYDAIHASPPCERYSPVSRTAGVQQQHPDLLADTRDALLRIDRPYILENVEGAQTRLHNPLLLCGTMFGLYVRRHRLFETNWKVGLAPSPCWHHLKTALHGRAPRRFKEFAAVTGHLVDLRYAGWAMGILWMKREELAEAIPPAYTHFIGQRLMGVLADGW